MEMVKADVVRSLRGRDSGELFFVLTVDGDYAMIVNGKDRRIEKPKKKKLKHLAFVERSEDRTDQKLRSGDKVTNSELRRALLAKRQGEEAEGGMHDGER